MNAAHPRRHPAVARPEAWSLEPVDVAVVCEATYPYVTGGLSAVVHQLCTGLPQLRLGVIHIAWDSQEPLTPVYEVPGNVAWVHPVFTSMAEHPEFKKLRSRELQSAPRRQAVADRLFAAFAAHLEGNDTPLWSLYDDMINPVTRQFSVWPLLASEEFMDRAVAEFGERVPLSKLFWQLRDFASIVYALTGTPLPRATVYHAHTTGGAGVLAAAAARQHQTRYLLTEHNLYTRDAINLMLERSCSNVVTRSTWRELTSYLGGDAVNPAERRVTDEQRTWMAWTTILGEISYRAADRITYLYPEAIDEAAGLGGRPAISEVIANGIDTAPYLPGRAEVANRLRRTVLPGHRWRLAYAARVVAIKGLLDLIEAIAELERQGFVNFTLDVMGPTEEEPAYVEACLARIRSYGLHHRIRLLGTVRIPTELPKYDLLVLPSHNEGAPIIILEALALGLPVLATQVGGVEALLVRPQPDPNEPGRMIGAAGVVTGPGSVPGLVAALAQVMTHPEEHAEHSRNAVVRAERLFHIDLVVARYAEIFTALGVPSPSAAPRARSPLTPTDPDTAMLTRPRRAIVD